MGGNCAPARGHSRSVDKSNPMMQRNPLWEKIRDSNFDAENFLFVQEIQDIYTQVYGAYLLPDRVGLLVLEFKRYMYLVARYYAKNLPINVTPQDRSMYHFPSPKLLPSPIVDRLWRLLCSNTRVYQNFCNTAFGALLDRSMTLQPSLEEYNATLSIYETEFGEEPHVVWPPYGTKQALEKGYGAFLYMKVSDFLEFHRHFERRYSNFTDYDTIQEVYDRETQILRASCRQGVAKQEKRKVTFATQPMVDAQPNNFTNPIKRTERKDFNKAELSDDDIEPEDTVTDNTRIEESRFKSSMMLDVNEEEKLAKDMDETPLKQEGEQERPAFIPRSLISPSNKQDLRPPPLSQPPKEKVNLNDKFLEEIEKQCDENEQKQRSEEEYFKQPEEDKEMERSGQARQNSKNVLRVTWKEEMAQLNDTLWQFQMPVQVTGFFQKEMNTTPDLTALVYKEYKRFMLLYSLAREGQLVIPSQWVKIAWEDHIVQSASYRKFCYQVFKKYQHSQHLPRKPDDTQRESYTNTLITYKEVFGEYPPVQIWPEPEDRFDYDTLFSYKFFNIRGYMSEVINQVEKKELEWERQYSSKELTFEHMKERQRSISTMAVSPAPSRGKEYISMKSTTQSIYEEAVRNALEN